MKKRSKTSGSYLRANYLSHTVWDAYDQIVDACCQAWNAFIQVTAHPPS